MSSRDRSFAFLGAVVLAFGTTSCSGSGGDGSSESPGDAGDPTSDTNTVGAGDAAGDAAIGRSDAGKDGAPSPGDGGLDAPIDSSVPPLPPAVCSSPRTTLPATAPALTVGVWKNISPAGVAFHVGGGDDVFTQGVTLDPCDVGTLYLGVCGFKPDDGNVGLYKSTDAGTTWKKTGKLDEPIHVRVNPKDRNRLYAADGVRGGTQGFWVSRDGGETWTMPDGFAAVGEANKLYQIDVYDVAADPSDFDHVLVTSHSPWNGFGKYPSRNEDSGVLESRDGGKTWIVHDPEPGWSHGNGIWFLHAPGTWLLGTQDAGYFRTGDAGAHWSLATSDVKMQHGGGGIYASPLGKLYAGGVPHLMRSSDDGVSWTPIGPYAGFNTILGDGENLYSAPVGGPKFVTAKESDDTKWSDFPGGPAIAGGPFEMTYDATNHIVYAANWAAGLWALKVR